LRNDDRRLDTVMDEAHMVGRSFELRRDRRDEDTVSIEFAQDEHRPLKGSMLAVLLGADIEALVPCVEVFRRHMRFRWAS
jgi:hypothetical protein